MHFQETGKKRVKEEMNKMEIQKVTEKNRLCKIFFYNKAHHNNTRTAGPTGSKSQFAQCLASKKGE